MRTNDFDSGGHVQFDAHVDDAPAPFSERLATPGLLPMRPVPAAPLSRRRGQPDHDAQLQVAPSDTIPNSDGQATCDTQTAPAVAPFSNGGGQGNSVTHCPNAPADPSCDRGHVAIDAQANYADVAPLSCREGQNANDIHRAFADPALIRDIREHHRRRVDLMRAMQRLTLQIKAICRRFCDGDKTEAEVLYKAITGKGEHPLAAAAGEWCTPFLVAQSCIEEDRKGEEKQLKQLAKQLHVAEWVEGVRGFALPSLAAVIGETGDLFNYDNPAKLWKRMGLAVIQGGRQRRVTGDAALEHGYSPDRRSIMWNIGGCVIKSGSGHYREVYDERKAFEIAKAEAAGLTVAPAGKIPKKRAAEFMSAGHVHNRAQRYMEKRLLRDLWRVWRQA